jgi:hypothetical protein
VAVTGAGAIALVFFSVIPPKGGISLHLSKFNKIPPEITHKNAARFSWGPIRRYNVNYK